MKSHWCSHETISFFLAILGSQTFLSVALLAADILSGNTVAAAGYVPVWGVFACWVLFTRTHNPQEGRSGKRSGPGYGKGKAIPHLPLSTPARGSCAQHAQLTEMRQTLLEVNLRLRSMSTGGLRAQRGSQPLRS